MVITIKKNKKYIILLGVEIKINNDTEKIKYQPNLVFDIQVGSELNLTIIHNLNNIKEVQKIRINHIGNESKSSVQIFSVLKSSSLLDFTGIIYCPRNIKNVESNLQHKTLLLSDDCDITSQPELLINSQNICIILVVVN